LYPSPFRYHRAATLADAIARVANAGDEAQILAGGQSLIAMMKTRLAAPTELVDIGFIPGLAYLQWEADCLRLGALTRHRDVELASVGRGLEILHDAASVIADVQVRNRGTVCGSLAHADPAGDWAPVMLALGAELEIAGPDGTRTVPVRKFFLDFFTTELRCGEVVRELRIPITAERRTGAYLALKRRAGDYAIASVAVSLVLDAQGMCVAAGIGLGNVGPTPLIADEAERRLIGNDPTDEQVIAAVVAAAVAAARPGSDNHGSAEYKREVVGALVRRALDIAVRRHHGETIVAYDHV